MRKLLFLVFLLPAVTFAQQRVTSSIREITVFLQGAQIVRTANTTLQQGTQEVIFEGLSNFIDANSITIEGQGKATILSVNYRLNYLQYNAQTDEEKRLNVMLDTAQRRLAYFQNEKAGLEEELKLLADNRKIRSDEKGAFVDDLQDAVEFYSKQTREVRNRLTDMAPQENKMIEEVNRLKQQLAEMQAKNTKPSGEIVVTISADSREKAEFVLRYYTTRASWTPDYNVRARGGAGPVAMEYNALVSQQTGEFWNDVKLTLSTGNPTLGGTAPVFMPAYLDYQQFIYRKRKPVPYISDGMKMEAAPEMGKDQNAPNMDWTTSSISQNPTTVSFEINMKYDIPSDGLGKLVRIQQYSLPADFTYFALPRQDADAFLQAHVTGWDTYNLMPGEANIFLEDAFVGKTYIDPSTTSDTLNISFGRDKRIVIKRNKDKDVTEKQLVGGNKVRTFAYSISIRNSKDKQVELTLVDLVPVSKQKDMVVELTEKGNADYDPQTGKLTWKLSVKPSETQTVKFEYTVKYPKNQIVTGLY